MLPQNYRAPPFYYYYNFFLGSRNFVNRQYAQVRSDWVPTERGGRASVVFPLSSNTNAGQLNYQIQDAAKQRAEKDVIRTSTTSRSVYFQDYPELKTSQPVNELKSVSGFRPSQAYPITSSASEPVVEKREFPTVQSNAPYASIVEYKSFQIYFHILKTKHFGLK